MNKLMNRLMVGGSIAALAAAQISAANAQSTGDNSIEQVVVSASRISIAGYTQPTPVTMVSAALLEDNAKNDIGDSIRQLPAVQGASPQSGSNSVTISGAPAGQSNAFLRNLGILRTLVLVDSQRIVQSNITGGVDLNTVPSSLVERVDVVTGGASAAWGSDAVAGVINLILNKNFTGIKANAEFSDNSADLYKSVKLEGSYGTDVLEGRGHLIFSGSYQYSPNTIYSYQESWYNKTQLVPNPAYNASTNSHVAQLIRESNIGQSTATEGGIIVSNPKGTTATSANALRGIEFVGAGIPTQVNFGNIVGPAAWGGDLTYFTSQTPITEVAIPSRQVTLFAYGAYKLSDTVRASVQLNYGQAFAQNTGQAAMKLGNLTIQSDNAYIPASVKATMTLNGIPNFVMGTTDLNNVDPHNLSPGATALSLGIPVNNNYRQQIRAVFSLDGTIGNDWGWNAYIQHGQTKVALRVISNTIVNDINLASDAVTVSAANVGATGLAIGSIACRSVTADPTVSAANRAAGVGCRPLNVFGIGVADPAAIAWINSYNRPDREDITLNQDVVSGSVQGTLPWQLPAGAIAVATGAEYRHEIGRTIADPRGVTSQWGSGNFANFAGGYTVAEGFMEVDAPVLKNQVVQSLNLNGAGRITSYSTSGMVETWKLGQTAQIDDNVRLRTTWSTDIRAPNLSELFTTHQINTGANIDLNSPSCTSTTPNQFGFINSIAGCNSPNTSNDKGGNINLVPEVAHTITSGVVLTPTFINNFQLALDWYNISIQKAIVTLAGSPTNCAAALALQYCSLLEFSGPINANGKPALSVVHSLPVNAASERVSGVDIQMDYAFDFLAGNLTWQLLTTYVDEHTIVNVGVACDQIGQVGLSGCGGDSIPKFKGTLSATYKQGPWSLTAQSRFQGSYVLNSTWTSGVQVDKNAIDPNAYLDLRASYKWTDAIQVYGAIDNTLNIPPILVPPLASTGSSYQSLGFAGDNLGRVMRIGVRLAY